MENQIPQEATNTSITTQSFGVDKWHRKKSRYEFEDFIVSPPSQEEGSYFQLRYGKANASKSSTYNKITQELKQDPNGTLAGSVMSYIGVGTPVPSRGDVGGAISMDAHGGLTFDDFSGHTSSPSYDIMPDLTLETQVFPQADPLISLPWGRRHTLTNDDAKISQAVKNLKITGKEVAYADITTQACESLTLNTSTMVNANHLNNTEESPKRERKRSGLEEYVSSIAKQSNKPRYEIEEEHDEEDEKEIKRRLSRENKSYLEISSEGNEDTQQNIKHSYDNQDSHHDNFNERCAEDQNNDLHYETYKPLTLIEPSDKKKIENEEKKALFIDENLESQEMENKLIAQETIKFKSEEDKSFTSTKEEIKDHVTSMEDLQNRKTSKEGVTESVTSMKDLQNRKESKEEVKEPTTSKDDLQDRKTSKERMDDLRSRKTSLLELVSPFIPFKDPIEENSNSLTPVTPKSKTGSRFFCTEKSEESKTSSSLEPDLLQASAQLQNTESKPKTRKRRPKPSALREMNVWGPSSM